MENIVKSWFIELFVKQIQEKMGLFIQSVFKVSIYQYEKEQRIKKAA